MLETRLRSIVSSPVSGGGGSSIGGTITGGTAGSILFVGAGPVIAQDNANLFWDDTDNRLFIGNNATISPAFSQLQGIATSSFNLSLHTFAASTASSNLFLCKSRGSTIGSYTIVNASDVLGEINFYGSDGTDWALSSYFQCIVTGTPADNNVSSYLVFNKNNGAGTFTQAFKVGPDGFLIDDWLEIGTVTDAATAGDFSTGLVNAARLFYDQSVPALYLYDALNALLLTLDGDITFASGKALKTSTSAGNTVLLQAYDVDGAAYTTFATLTANNTPTFDLATGVTIGTAYIYRVGGTDISLADGGSNASLTASNGGIVYSTATALAILAGTATANQILLSGASGAPVWSTSTYPATNAINTLLYASSANVMAALATANSGVLVTSGTGVPSIATDIPTAVTIGTAYIYRVGGTDVAVADGGTGLSTIAVSQILYASALDTIAGLATANNGVLITSGTGVPSIATDIPTAVTIGSAYITRVGGTDVVVTDGGTGLSATTAYAVLCGGTTTTAALQSIAGVGSSGQVLTSNGAGALPTFQAAGGGTWTTIIKPADEFVTNDTLLNADTDLQFSMAASTNYRIRLRIFITGHSDPDFKYSITGPASPTRVHIAYWQIVLGSVTQSNLNSYPGSTTISLLTADNFQYFEMVVQNGANAGVFAFNFAQFFSSATPTGVKEGSSLEYVVT